MSRDDRTWAVRRLQSILQNATNSDEYRAAQAKYKEDHDYKEFIKSFAWCVAPWFGEDRILIEEMKKTLIPGLREVNDELARYGKYVEVNTTGNRLDNVRLVDA
jgi:hypothetical protein